MNAFNSIVDKVTEMIYEREPSLLERYGERGKEKCREDNHHHMKHLQTAFELDNQTFFTDYAIWLDGILTKHGMTSKLLIDNFNFILDVLDENEDSLTPQQKQSYTTYLTAAIGVLEGKSVKEGS
ncbi:MULTISPECIES: hypothetical protein [unclassified Bacillus (in: firmicutes)]|uniref:hypothetical protein n=1 Tax=unclassified Bacillus (in: firmicutes) TaxID=185979 RepID=UPI0008E270E9|nr:MULTISPECIES: hypothetical protein [unclassified Bacillus (in: firmicutes)]SFB21873.1 hypothetical protein SAMN02799634_10931 [Bacillus sp. UNCCL13]SFQ91046.1 hypothetical protein SAMN04488577_4010 [Bacillus sp. cl95]